VVTLYFSSEEPDDHYACLAVALCGGRTGGTQDYKW